MKLMLTLRIHEKNLLIAVIYSYWLVKPAEKALKVTWSCYRTHFDPHFEKYLENIMSRIKVILWKNQSVLFFLHLFLDQHNRFLSQYNNISKRNIWADVI